MTRPRCARSADAAFYGVFLLIALVLTACRVDLDPAKEGFACNLGSECEHGLSCLDGFCVVDPCADVECREGEVCAFGSCYAKSCETVDCPADLICLDEQCVAIECANVDCDAGEACAGGRCHPTDCPEADCGAGVCVDGRCTPRSCVGVTCSSGQACALGECHSLDCHISCAPGEVCFEGSCTERACAGISCPAGEACGRGLCWPESCSDQGGPSCGEAEVCVDLSCTPPSCAGVECPPGSACAAGECRFTDCAAMECGSRQVCDDELDVCVLDICYGRSCPKGQRCAREAGCVDIDCGDMSCGDGEVCDDSGDMCVEVACRGVSCSEGRRCVRGDCYRTSCTLEQCDPGEVCVDGACVEHDCVGVMCPSGMFCSGGRCVEVGDAFAMEKVSGDDQTAIVTGAVAGDLVVRVVDDRGNPVAGHGVSFAIADVPSGATGQSISVASTETGEDGRASTMLTLGDRAGTYRVRATATGGLAGSPLTFVVTAIGGAATVLEAVSGDEQAAVVTTTLPEPFVVRAMDDHGNPSPDQEVVFSILEAPGGASDELLTVTDAVTDSAGLAETTLTLGSVAGEYQVEAMLAGAGDVPTLTFSVTGLPGPEHALEEAFGNEQSAAVTTTLAEPLAVRVVDEHGNPCEGVEVRFAFDEVPDGASEHSLSTTLTSSDPDGLATVEVELGTEPGTYVVRAFVIPVLEGSPVLFHATATPGGPSVIDMTVFHSQPLYPGQPVELVLAIEDEIGNIVTDWTGVIELVSDTDPWAEIPASVEMLEEHGGMISLDEISFSVSDSEHEIRAFSGDLEGTVGSITVLTGSIPSLLVEQTAEESLELGTVWSAFELGGAWPADGVIELVFPSSLDLGSATLVELSGADGDFSLELPDQQTARVVRDGGARVSAGTEIVVRLGDVLGTVNWPDWEVSVQVQVEDGRVIEEGEATVSVVGRSWSKVSTGGLHTCATDVEGRLWCWGEGGDGQIGGGAFQGELTPLQVYGTYSDWTAVSAGDRHTCGIRAVSGSEGGRLFCWGLGAEGQLGIGDHDSRSVPTEVEGDHTDWLSVSAGSGHTCGIRFASGSPGGRMYCWGRGLEGQLGDGDAASSSVPLEVDGAHDDWLSTSAGGQHTCGIRASGAAGSGTLWCWGAGGSGQLGNGAIGDRLSPTGVAGSYDDWTGVSAGAEHTCGMRVEVDADAGTLWCFGLGDFGRLGNDSFSMRTAPISVFGDHDDWLVVAAGLEHTCGVRETGSSGAGEAYCFGNNEVGQLGCGDLDNRARPEIVHPGADDWVVVDAGAEHSCGLRRVGRFGRALWCWGNGEHGRLGSGDEIVHEVPVRVE